MHKKKVHPNKIMNPLEKEEERENVFRRAEKEQKKGMMEKIILEFTSNDAIPSNAFYQGHTRD